MKNLNNVTKVKRFEMKPMYEDEAILQMKLLGHDFFLFHNVNEDRMCLLYVRKNGELGMIVSEQL